MLPNESGQAAHSVIAKRQVLHKSEVANRRAITLEALGPHFLGWLLVKHNAAELISRFKGGRGWDLAPREWS
jgi:hypothetical protein